jgi:peptidoglycan/xylan/chitin deacetylase (PgdA/CDA1 family)
MKTGLLLQLVVLKSLGLGLVLGTDWDFIGWILFFTGSGIVVAHLLMPRWQGVCEVIYRFDASGKSVWLTIDDGPDPEDTPRILELLERYEAKATFFMIGTRAEKYPELVRRVVAAGHTIGTHSYSHPMAGFWWAGPQRVADELDRSLAALAVSQTPHRPLSITGGN